MVDGTSSAVTSSKSTTTQDRYANWRWESVYRGLVVLADLLVIAMVLGLGLIITGRVVENAFPGFVASVTGLVLVGTMIACRTWRARTLGQGTAEFRSLAQALVLTTVVLALTALVLDAGNFRPWVFGVVPVTAMALLVTRYCLRLALHTQRARGRCMRAILVAGDPDEVADLIDRTRREWRYGWRVTGVCLPGASPADQRARVRDVPVLGGLGDVAAVASQGGFSAVVITPDSHWRCRRLRRLAWDLEGTPTDLVIAPTLMEVTGPRLHVAPVYGLTLMHVSQPTFRGGRWIVKAVFDRVAALAALVVLAPLLLVVAVLIKYEDGGPVLFRQQRVGKGGTRFWMLKFRSMVVDAERWQAELAAVNEGSGPLFKLRHDPRVTRVGAVLRRYSLDELPQLVNVLLGAMSLVGPRPPLPAEVEQYCSEAQRRLLVKPGLTGLWQVSGRSDLSWEESVQLDLRYVENGSLIMDAAIIWKTAAAVFRRRGAY